MPRITVFTCDSCKKNITESDYQTISIRRYTGVKHDKVLRPPTMWLCNRCYKKMAKYMAFPPYDEEGDRNETD